jgi:membrane protease YdiL (CAAX protease family)
MKRALIAPWWHTGIVLGVLAAGVIGAISTHGTSTASEDRHGGIALYASVICFEWAMFALTYAGTRKRVALRELTGVRWLGRTAFVRSALITVAFWFVWEGSDRAMHRLLGASEPVNVSSMLPRTSGEIFGWICLSISAGICEEFIFRGYLQRQLAAMTRSGTAGLVLQAVAFGVSHGYQGWKRVVIIAVLGVLYGLLARWRRSLVPGTIAHIWGDIYGGWLNP